jgi:tight adherence protein B
MGNIFVQLLPIGITVAIFVSVMMVLLMFSKRAEGVLDGLTGKYAVKLKQEFELLQLPFTPTQFMAFQLGIVLVLFGVGIITGPDPTTKLAVGALFGYIGFWLTRRYVAEQHKRRQQRFKEQFADAAALIGNAVRSGLSLFQGLEIVVKEMDDPIAYEVYQVLQATKVGAPLDTVLEDWARRMGSPDLDIFVTAINIQRQTGGDLSYILNMLASTIRQRQKIQGQIQALTAQGRLGSYVLSGLPIFMGVVLYFINPQRMGLVLTEPLGWGMMAVSATTITIGIVVIRKIVDIDI